ncbi:MAG: hypothetical protein K0Q72_3761 [Armatimonadetes bacterium]|nr:hypothetical protein [Armatimonadota bacterium]
MITVVFGVLCVVSSAFLRGANPATDWHLLWARQEAPGRITHVRATQYTELEHRVHDQRVYQYRYEFRLPDGTTRQGVGYSTGRILAPDPLPPGGHPVMVDYHPQLVQANRLRQGRASPLTFYWAMLLFPIIGLAGGVAGVRSAVRKAQLLQNGELANGRVTHVYLRRRPNDSESSPEMTPLAEAVELTPTGDSTRCKFDFITPGNTRAEGSGTVRFVSELFEQPEVTVLYSPSCPQKALLLDEIGVYPDARGDWEAGGKSPSRMLVALAAISLILGPALAWLNSQQPVGLQ